jgi:hypothetical protein
MISQLTVELRTRSIEGHTQANIYDVKASPQPQQALLLCFRSLSVPLRWTEGQFLILQLAREKIAIFCALGSEMKKII